jgi:hypothetical protein
LKRTLSIAVLLTLVLVGNVRVVQAGYPEAGLDERPGSVIPLDLTFQNEEGKNVVLKSGGQALLMCYLSSFEMSF